MEKLKIETQLMNERELFLLQILETKVGTKKENLHVLDKHTKQKEIVFLLSDNKGLYSVCLFKLNRKEFSGYLKEVLTTESINEATQRYLEEKILG